MPSISMIKSNLLKPLFYHIPAGYLSTAVSLFALGLAQQVHGVI